ncbi:MAG TPA: NAD-dependent epimerase/dehydratase family protein, partial [Gemmatimonadaceae bacterium]
YFYNGFGPRERGDGKYATVIAKFEQQYLRGEPITVVKPGTQRRAFTYVKDLARGIILTARKGKGDGYALGVNRTRSIIEIARAFGGPIKLVAGYAGRAEAKNPLGKARALGWKPTLDVMDYIAAFLRAHPRAP